MSITKLSVIKCLSALVLGLAMVTTLVAYAATGSQNTVTITDGGKTFDLITYCKTAEEILNDADITLLADDIVDFELSDGTGTLTIHRAFPVYITTGTETIMLKMPQGTVTEALKRADIVLGEYDICNMSPDTVLSGESYIDIISVEYVTTTYEETIPYTTKVEYTSSLPKGETKIETAGVNGVKTVTVQQRIENGVVTNSEVVSTETTKQAVVQKKLIGTKTVTSTKKAPAAAKKAETAAAATSKKNNAISTLSGSVSLDANGIPTSYTKTMTFQASAYTCSASVKCATGVTPQPGYIAVNPNVIPYGTKMYIVSKDGKYVYGYAIAADTGGFATRNPYMVDLFFPTKSECNTFGVRDVVIYFLD